MKISIEIKDKNFEFEYTVGASTGHGTMPYGIDQLCTISELLQTCHRFYNNKTHKDIKEIECMAYIEQHPELLKKYKESKKKNN